MNIRVYFEGHRLLRTGFEAFFRELRRAARRAGSRIDFIAANDGASMYRKAARTHPDAWNILLKDSEGELPANVAARFSYPENVFCMVQLMEAWFLADSATLKSYYRSGFSESAIGNTDDVEKVPKRDVLERLKRATVNTSKGRYHKVAHAPHLLEGLDPAKVQERADHCKTLFNVVRRRIKQPV